MKGKNALTSQSSYLDVVYVVKEDENNEELRYSLRSLVNLPYRKVFIAGYKPSWVKNVEYLPVKQLGGRFDNQSRIIKTACSNNDVFDDFILMNDDFFIINNISHVPNLRRLKPIEHYIKQYTELYMKPGFSSFYLETMKDIAVLLRRIGFRDIDSYELHVPMVINKDKYLALCSMYPETESSHRRTMYGNYYHIGGKRINDVKVVKDGKKFSKDVPFLSTIDDVFDGSEVGRFIMTRFTEKCTYER